MFIQHSVHIAHPIADCRPVFENRARRWFPGVDATAEAVVGIHVAGVPVRKRVELVLGASSELGQWLEVPFAWTATDADKLFPKLVGKLVLVQVEPNVTRLTVSGMYSAPLGKVGQKLDDAVMHKVANATLKELAKSIAGYVDHSITQKVAAVS
jgi:hypothetical protein